MELQPKPCQPTASSWFITTFSSFLFGFDFATLLTFIIFSFSVIPPIVFGILFWSLLLSVVFFLRRHGTTIVALIGGGGKLTHKSDPVYSPGTFAHNKVLQTYQTQTHTHPCHLLQNHVLLRVQKETKQTVAKPHSQTSSPPFLPSSFSFTPSSLILYLQSQTPSCLLLLDSSIMLFPREHPSPAPSLRTRFNCLPPDRCFHFCLGYWLLTQYHPRCARTLWTDLTLFHPIPKSWVLIMHL